MKPCDVVNALYRGEAMIVAGDEKRSPRAASSTGRPKKATLGTKKNLHRSSLYLEKASALAPSVPCRDVALRSRHENLIVSNHRFYGGALLCSERFGDCAGSGVESFIVHGVYRRGTLCENAIEAQAAWTESSLMPRQGNEALESSRSPKDRHRSSKRSSSATVGTRSRVCRSGERRPPRRCLHQGLDVQGDEREAIIFSVGMGKTNM